MKIFISSAVLFGILLLACGLIAAAELAYLGFRRWRKERQRRRHLFMLEYPPSHRGLR
jgi:hypothetical protein